MQDLKNLQIYLLLIKILQMKIFKRNNTIKMGNTCSWLAGYFKAPTVRGYSFSLLYLKSKLDYEDKRLQIIVPYTNYTFYTFWCLCPHCPYEPKSGHTCAKMDNVYNHVSISSRPLSFHLKIGGILPYSYIHFSPEQYKYLCDLGLL